MSKVGIVVLNYNTYDYTKKCVDSILSKVSRELDYKVYLVDNNSPDKSGLDLKKSYVANERIEVILSSCNGGNSAGWNIGLRVAVNEGCVYCFCFDSDLLMLNDAVKCMVDILDSHSEVGLVGPALLDKDMKYIQYAGDLFTPFSMFYSLKKIGPILSKIFKRKRRIDYNSQKDFFYWGIFSGCCMGIRSEFLKKINFLDEYVKFYHEEDILAYQLRNEKYKSCICSNASIIHYGGTSTKKANEESIKAFRRFYAWSGAIYVFKKYAHTNIMICSIWAISSIIIWGGLSIIHKDYRCKMKDYVIEVRKALKQ